MELNTIVVATDGSSHAERAIELACDIAKSTGASLKILHAQREIGSSVVPDELKRFSEVEHVRITERDILRSVANDILEKAKTQAIDSGLEEPETVHRVGDPAKAIVDYARESGADLIVVGSRGLGELASVLMGSVSHKVINMAPCPCLVVP